MFKYLKGDRKVIDIIGEKYDRVMEKKKRTKRKFAVHKEVLNSLVTDNIISVDLIPEKRSEFVVQTCHSIWKNGLSPWDPSLRKTNKKSTRGLLSEQQFNAVIFRIEQLIASGELSHDKLEYQLNRAKLREIVKFAMDEEQLGLFDDMSSQRKFSRYYLCQTLKPKIMKRFVVPPMKHINGAVAEDDEDSATESSDEEMEVQEYDLMTFDGDEEMEAQESGLTTDGKYYNELIESNAELLQNLRVVHVKREEEVTEINLIGSDLGYQVFNPCENADVVDQIHFIFANQRTLTDVDRNCWLLTPVSTAADNWVLCLLATARVQCITIPPQLVAWSDCLSAVLCFVRAHKMDVVQRQTKNLLNLFYDMNHSHKPSVCFHKLSESQVNCWSEKFDAYYSDNNSGGFIRCDKLLMIALSTLLYLDLVVHDEPSCHFCSSCMVCAHQHFWMHFRGTTENCKRSVHMLVSKGGHYSGAVLHQELKSSKESQTDWVLNTSEEMLVHRPEGE